jgi:hypothetical protein
MVLFITINLGKEFWEGVGERGKNDPNIVCTYELK